MSAPAPIAAPPVAPKPSSGVALDAMPESGATRRNASLLFATLGGGALLFNATLAGWTYEQGLPPDERLISGFCALAGASFLSLPVLARSARAVLSGRRDLGELASVAILACFAIGAYREAGVVAFLLTLAQLLEDRSALGARKAVEGLVRLTPKDAHLVEGEDERAVPVTSLARGATIRVRPGESIPVDGRVTRGDTTINQASVTGESLPVDVAKGDPVFAGTVNLTGLIELEVEKVGGDTTLGRVREMILSAEATRLPVMRLIDRYLTWYTPTMIMIAALIFYFTKDLDRAITALIVACPCALVLATPTAMVAGLSCAARLGILVKNVAHLELAGQLTAMVFDKTGTLTTGTLSVTRLAPCAGVSPGDLLATAASAERHSNHPAARAIVALAAEARVPLHDAEALTEVGGQGVRARVAGHGVCVGRRRFLAAEGVDVDGFDDSPEQDAEQGYSLVYVARDGAPLGFVALVDQTRPEALRATEQLKQLGIAKLTMLTGDRWGAARRVAAELGCTELVAECLPEQKLALVEELKQQGWRVAVVGDGVNDAPALAAGHLGVAMGAAGNDVAIHSATVALMSDDLERIPLLIRLSRMLRSTVLQNLAFGVLLMVIGLVMSGLGWLSPITAALLTNVGSLAVVFNSARVVRFGEGAGSAAAGGQP